MVARDRLGRGQIRSMAYGLIDHQTLGCCAKDHAPKGEVDFNCRQHLGLSPCRGLKSPMAADRGDGDATSLCRRPAVTVVNIAQVPN
jgi:hypothetical protein